MKVKPIHKQKATLFYLKKGMLIMGLSQFLQYELKCDPRSYARDDTKLIKLEAKEDALASTIANAPDISEQYGGIDILHCVVEANHLTNVKDVLTRINEDKAQGCVYQHTNFPNTLDKNGRTVLEKVIRSNQQAIAKELIENKYIDIVKENSQGNTPLHLAARYNKRKIFCLLFDELTTRESSNESIKKQLFSKGDDNHAPYHVFTAACFARQKIMNHRPEALKGKDYAMFKHVLSTTVRYLDKEDYERIAKDIQLLTEQGKFEPKLSSKLLEVIEHYIKHASNHAATSDSGADSSSPPPPIPASVPHVTPPASPTSGSSIPPPPTIPASIPSSKKAENQGTNSTETTDLLSAIRAGKKLNPAGDRKLNDSAAAGKPSLQEALKKALDLRRVNTDDDEEEEEEDEDKPWN